MSSFVYILASQRNGTLYVGVTADLLRRMEEHTNKLVDGFTKKYAVEKLVYYEIFDDINQAIKREKSIKTWRRAWKLELIEKSNAAWEDLYDKILQSADPFAEMFGLGYELKLRCR
jgi:putative endonuclease